jgi:hypothetical protein
MRLSIFSSKTPTKAHIVLVLALCALFCLTAEAVTGYFFGRVSRIESRREGEYRMAMMVRSGKPQRKLSVLLAGNSLLLHGVDFPELQSELGPEVQLYRVVFEGTSYLDWFYGLNHIFRQGARPDVVVLLLSPVQFTDDESVGDYGARMLVDHRDILSYARDVGADRNRTSVLALDNLSFFFGARAEIRTWILGKLLPDLPRLTNYFRGNSDSAAYTVPLEVATSRLAQLRATCGRYGAAFLLTIPPTREDSPAEARAVELAGASQGVPVLVPVGEGVLPKSDYADLVHLNPQGAARFTRLFAGRLRQFVRGSVAAQATAGPVLVDSASVRVIAKEKQGGQLTPSSNTRK